MGDAITVKELPRLESNVVIPGARRFVADVLADDLAPSLELGMNDAP